VPRDGVYDLRITAELWETHFFDHVALLVVDHPAGTDIYVDERFAVPPPALTVYPTAPRGQSHVPGMTMDRRSPILYGSAMALPRHLRTGHLSGRDARTLCRHRPWRGHTASGPLWLLASGWIHPTDSSLTSPSARSPRSAAEPAPGGAGRPGRLGGGEIRLGSPLAKPRPSCLTCRHLRPGTPPGAFATNLEIYWTPCLGAGLA